MNESFLTESHLKTLREIHKSVPKLEFDMFLIQVERTRLDPFAKQIYLIKRGDKYQTQVSVDGLRLIAYRTGRYKGQTPTEWCGLDGQWKDVWLEKAPPAASRVGIYMEGLQVPTFRVATYKSYCPKFPGLWLNMPDVMLAKVAESLALRTVAPAETSGLYTEEEMDQAGKGEDFSFAVVPVAGEKKAEVAQSPELASDAVVEQFLREWDKSYSEDKDAPVRPETENLKTLTRAHVGKLYKALPSFGVK
jgi:phage recombination protein Bet